MKTSSGLPTSEVRKSLVLRGYLLIGRGTRNGKRCWAVLNRATQEHLFFESKRDIMNWLNPKEAENEVAKAVS
jgi:hypothetical protein